MEEDILQLEKKIYDILHTVYDPEIPVNIYDLGLIYDVDIDDYNNVEITMTLTAPNCPVADSLVMEVRDRVADLPDTNKVNVNLTFDPPWEKSMMSEQAMLELGFL
ncbi:MAG: iron-sulfur cluster assembly protein [Bacteroidales bacterium]|nr:iron-sulfur cluster assembly protein [Bacteroidales bacterium]